MRRTALGFSLLCLLLTVVFAQTVQAPVVRSITFASTVNADGSPRDPGRQFQVRSLAALHAFVAYDGFSKGMKVAEVWTRESQVIKEKNYVWDGWALGIYDSALDAPSGGFLPGKYAMAVSIDGVRLLYADFSLADTSQRYPGLAVPMRGRVIDADTKRGISGAMIGVLEPGALIKDWKENESKMLSGSMSDSSGSFIMPSKLPRGLSYSIFVTAGGYEPIYADLALRIVPDQIDPVTITITMKRLRL